MTEQTILQLACILPGLVMTRWYPKKINWWGGYRTRRSMSSQRLWDAGNVRASKLMTRAGLIILLFGLVMSQSGSVYAVLAVAGAVLPTMLIVIWMTEKYLKGLE